MPSAACSAGEPKIARNGLLGDGLAQLAPAVECGDDSRRRRALLQLQERIIGDAAAAGSRGPRLAIAADTGHAWDFGRKQLVLQAQRMQSAQPFGRRLETIKARTIGLAKVR